MFFETYFMFGSLSGPHIRIQRESELDEHMGAVCNCDTE